MVGKYLWVVGWILLPEWGIMKFDPDELEDDEEFDVFDEDGLFDDIADE